MSGNKNLAAKLNVRRRTVEIDDKIFDHRKGIGGDVLAALAVAATQHLRQSAVAITHCRRYSVNFFFDQKLRVGEFFCDLVDKTGDVLRRKHIVNRKHWRVMLNVVFDVADFDNLRRRVGRNPIGMCLLNLLQTEHQLIVLAVFNLGLPEVIQKTMMQEIFFELIIFRAELFLIGHSTHPA